MYIFNLIYLNNLANHHRKKSGRSSSNQKYVSKRKNRGMLNINSCAHKECERPQFKAE